MQKGLLLFFGLIISNLSFGQAFHCDTTLVIGKRQYEVKIEPFKENRSRLTVYYKGKLIQQDTMIKGLRQFSFPDFNGDKKCDILLSCSGSGDYDKLYLFDKKHKAFRRVKGFELFPSAIKLKQDPELFMSYTDLGCDDMTWNSYLFRIVKFEAIPLAEMYGEGCEGKLQNIDIYKLTDSNPDLKERIVSYPYNVMIPEYSLKWIFIEKYWNDKGLQLVH
jgi:hypothetical protein